MLSCMGCGRHGKIQPLLRKPLTLNFPKDHQTNLACLEKVKQKNAQFVQAASLSPRSPSPPLSGAPKEQDDLQPVSSESTSSSDARYRYLGQAGVIFHPRTPPPDLPFPGTSLEGFKRLSSNEVLSHPKT